MLHITSALKNLLLEKSVRTGTFTLASGKESDLYIDCRMTALDPFGAALIGDLGWHAVRSKIHSEQLKIDAIGGMTLGAYVSGRAAGRISGVRQVGIGFACCGVAALGNVGYNAWVTTMTLPWAVLPIAVAAFGVAMIFPIITLAILDMYPRQRGSSSSLQAFTSLVLNALVAGVLSPLLSHHGLHLALAAAFFTLSGWLFWRWEMRVVRKMPQCPPDAAALEPTDRL